MTREMNADLVILDDLRARKAAERYSLDVIGTLGILVAAKRRGPIPLVRPVLDELVGAHGFRVAPALADKAARLAGEK